MRCSVLQCVAMCCSALQCVAMCCSALQCVAVYCIVLQYIAVCRTTHLIGKGANCSFKCLPHRFRELLRQPVGTHHICAKAQNNFRSALLCKGPWVFRCCVAEYAAECVATCVAECAEECRRTWQPVWTNHFCADFQNDFSSALLCEGP